MPDTAHVRIIPLRSSRSRAFREAYAIYEATIPKGEQKSRAQMLAGLRHPDFRFWAFEYEGRVAGMSAVYASAAQNAVLLEYLAVSPDWQGRGLGSVLFEKVLEAARFDARTVMLVEVDSERDEVSAAEKQVRLSRKQFYRRLGCAEVAGFDYILPLDTYGPPPCMNLLAHGAEGASLGTDWLRRAVEDIYVNVYQCRPRDPRIAAMFDAKGPRLDLV